MRRSLPRRLAVALAALGLLTGLSACHKHSRITRAETEGVYVDVGPMKYQIQISRQLNPSIREDATFLTGLPASDATIAPDEVWFAVFMRIENDSSRPHPPATAYEIRDTDENVYKPLPLSSTNPMAYGTAPVPAKSVVPDVNSLAGQTGINGVELLFKLKRKALDNRPLEMKIWSPELPLQTAVIALDV
jgi:hypothetical protein